MSAPINLNLPSKIARRYAEAFMTAQVKIWTPVDPVLATDASASSVDAIGVARYEGKARVASASGPVTYNVGDEPVYYSTAMGFIPIAGSDGVVYVVRVNDMLKVVTHHDPLMVGMVFRVTDVETGGEFIASRRLSLLGVQRQKTFTSPDAPVVPPEWRP